jgi:hypothetical protein
MATADDYAAWIVKNQDKRGTPDFDTVAKAYQEAKAEERMAEQRVAAPPAPPPAPGLLQQAAGVGETGIALATGATGGLLGALLGTGREITRQILSGQFGNEQSNQLVRAAAGEGARALTFEPRTQAGREMTQAAAQGLQQLPAFVPAVGPIGAIGAGLRQAAPAAELGVQRVGAVAGQVGQVVTAPVRMATEAVGLRQPTTTRAGSVGAAATPAEIERVATGEGLAVPFEGGAAFTLGQRTRDYKQLQFEKETAKLGEVGAPLRERVENQTAVMLQNFDAMIERPGPMRFEKRDIGKGVTEAVLTKANAARGKINDAYTKAREAGELAQEIEMAPLAQRLDDLSKYEGLVPTIRAVRNEATRLGAVGVDEAGQVVPGRLSLNDSEVLRQFVNDATDWTNRREALMGRRLIQAIDDSTEGQGGDLYKRARALRRQYAQEFENVGLTAKLLGTKRGTDDRQIAFEDVFDRVIISAPVDEMNRLRGTLLTAGTEGKQAWSDLKAKGVEYIKEAALSPSQRDSRGQPLLSPDKLNRVIKSLDQDGKLVSLYGKKQAQQLRDLAEIASVIYTAPPGAINTSNTASALQVALDSFVTFGATGVPAPALTALRQASKYVKDRKLKAQVEQSLKALER